MKNCQVCGVEVPEDYINLLCLTCYDKQTIKKEPEVIANDFGISDPSYQENPEADDKEQWMTNISQFLKTGIILWHPTRAMYETIKTYCLNKVTQHPQYPKYIWKPNIVDVGCGIGVGTNILSQEADMTWGIDKNENSLKFAKQCFERVKNGVYYSSQVTFDNVDIMKDTREFMKFDIVVAIEIIEHIYDTNTFLKNLIRFAKTDKSGSYMIQDPTEFFISTPNRNNKHIEKLKPHNPFHVREWTMEELFALLSRYFKNVEILNTDGKPATDRNDHTPILARTSIPR